MTVGEQLISSASLKTQFRDTHERRTYARSVEIARRITDDPGLLDHARRFVDRHMQGDPHQQAVYRLWSDLLQLPAAEIARRLIADDETGGYLRETAPVFTVIQPRPVEPFA